jgi:uncharacterized damage-inducible protein DinB
MSFFSELKSIGRTLGRKARGELGDDQLGVRSPERATLTATLDWYRQVVINKVDGLSREDATRVMTPTGLSPLGVIKHLTWAEAGWFRDTFAGQYQGWECSNAASFAVSSQDSIESVVADYRDECARSRTVIDAASSLDQLSAKRDEFYGFVSLRWLLVHMIEETACHTGHLDIMRELIDGRTGS